MRRQYHIILMAIRRSGYWHGLKCQLGWFHRHKPRYKTKEQTNEGTASQKLSYEPEYYTLRPQPPKYKEGETGDTPVSTPRDKKITRNIYNDSAIKIFIKQINPCNKRLTKPQHIKSGTQERPINPNQLCQRPFPDPKKAKRPEHQQKYTNKKHHEVKQHSHQ